MSIQTNFPNLKPTLLLDFANTEQLDPRITFTRASTGTFYNGVTTAKAEENLVLQSQDFNTASWSTTGVITGNTTTAPDGTTTAESFNDTVSSTFFTTLQTYAVTAGGTYTYSVFAKANAQTWVQLTNQTAAFPNSFANFNLSTGAVGVTTNCTASISSVGNGWYRCVITATATNSGNGGLVVVLTNSTDSASRAPTYTGVSTGIFLWGAQLEQRSAVSAYTPTTTQPITNYIPVLQTAASGVARFDHNPTTFESLGLLIEESRTNLVVRSEDFSTTWINERTTETTNNIVAPDGALTGDKLVEDTTASNTHLIYQGVSGLTDNTVYTFTVYLKAAERTKAVVSVMTKGAAQRGMIFDLSAGTVASYNSDGITDPTSSSIQAVGNGWYRCRISQDVLTGGFNPRGVVFLTNGTTVSYTGDGYSGFYVWGAQVEAGAFATSYIPTVASQVTRAADAASMTGTNFSSWYNQGEGTLYAESQTLTSTAAAFALQVSDNSYNNRIVLGQNSTSAVGEVIVNGSVTLSPTLNPLRSSASRKQAFAFANNNAQLATDNVQSTQDTSGVMATGLTRIDFGSDHGGFNRLNGTIRKIAYYPLRVTNAQLQALTS